MSAFPVVGEPDYPTQLQLVRDNLRLEISKLQATLAVASDYVEALELDRLPVAPAGDEAYDASHMPIAQNLLAQLQAETNATSTSFVFRVTTALGLK